MLYGFDENGNFTQESEIPVNPVTGKPFAINTNAATLVKPPEFDPEKSFCRWYGSKWVIEDKPEELPDEVQPEQPEPPQEVHIPTLEECKDFAMQAVNNQYSGYMDLLFVDYPWHERESWFIQIKEALEFDEQKRSDIAGASACDIPWIQECASASGDSVEATADAIIVRYEEFSRESGRLTGIRLKHKKAILALYEQGESAKDQLQNYDAEKYWDDGYLTPGELRQGTGKK